MREMQKCYRESPVFLGKLRRVRLSHRQRVECTRRGLAPLLAAFVQVFHRQAWPQPACLRSSSYTSSCSAALGENLFSVGHEKQHTAAEGVSHPVLSGEVHSGVVVMRYEPFWP